MAILHKIWNAIKFEYCYHKKSHHIKSKYDIGGGVCIEYLWCERCEWHDDIRWY